MTLHMWWLFVLAVFLLSGTPGPNMLHVLSRSVDLGFRPAMAAMLGCLSAVVSVLIASAVGLTALLMALPGVFDGLRYAGVAYLIYLGVRAWRADTAPLDLASGDLTVGLTPWRVYRSGFAIAISNPKLLLFAAAFFPQFIDRTASRPAQFAILITTFAVVECGWYAVYALGGRSLSRYLARPAVRTWFNRATGGIFIGFGLALLRTKPA